MTPKQREAYDYISGYCRVHGFSPTFEEIREALDLRSKSGVSRLIEGLERQGHIVRERNHQRSLIPADMVLGSSTKRAADFIADILRSHDAGRITAREALEAIRPVAAKLTHIV